MSTSSAYFRYSEKVPIRRFGNCRNAHGIAENVVYNLQGQAFVFTTIWRLFDKYCLVKLKVSDIFSFKIISLLYSDCSLCNLVEYFENIRACEY